jgi:hypothetical protein
VQKDADSNGPPKPREAGHFRPRLSREEKARQMREAVRRAIESLLDKRNPRVLSVAPVFVFLILRV